jgi:putative hemolysin
MKKSVLIILIVLIVILTACMSARIQPTPAPAAVATGTPQANIPNPAFVFCEQQGYISEIRTASDGSQTGYCIFPDGSECDEWAYYRAECGPAGSGVSPADPSGSPAAIPTAVPIDPSFYQGFWTYTEPTYGFSIMLPEDWVVEDVTTSDALMSGNLLTLHPSDAVSQLSIRMTFRCIGEDVRLWPTGVGQGEFIPQGTLDVAGQPAERVLLVCPTGEVTAIWYHQADGQPNIVRGDLEFGFIFSAGIHCDPGLSLNGKTELVGELIIASLKVP